jgi:hypothetical protein
MVPEYVATFGIKEMPGTHQVESGVGRPEASDIKHPYKAPVGDQSVRRNEVAVVHDVGSVAARQIAHPLRVRVS